LLVLSGFAKNPIKIVRGKEACASKKYLIKNKKVREKHLTMHLECIKILAMMLTLWRSRCNIVELPLPLWQPRLGW
jgi:hypothetical protein